MAKKKRHHSKSPAPQENPTRNGADNIQDAVADGGEGASPEETKKQPGWKAGLDFIAMLGGAVVVALLIKTYVMDVYVIPSGSMETALHGRPDGGDRIFSSKLSYRFRQPERWEIAVFKFPYEQARRRDGGSLITSEYRNQNFVKRIVGMPNESLVIGRGDIWVRPLGTQVEYRRAIKPDSVQRGMWLNVYAEDFSDISLPELERFWRISGDGAHVERGKGLDLRPDGPGAVQMAYRPMLPVGAQRDRLLEMPGIVDRYILRQPIQFRCARILDNGSECGHIFVKTLETQNIQARCPRCGNLADETQAVFYHRRSGLAAIGKFGVSPAAAPQGELVQPRLDDYNIVPDLRTVVDFTLENPSSVMTVTFREDNRAVSVTVAGDGQAALGVNGSPSRPEHRRVSGIRAGRAHKLECYVTEGRVRVFVDSAGEALLDEEIWNDQRPFPQNRPKSSGVSLAVAGGGARITNLKIDRDVFYFSGREHDESERYSSLRNAGLMDAGDRYGAMSSYGAVDIDAGSFFPMGDHCPSSYDARSWGPVPTNLLLGPALFIWWPPERISRIPAP